eukprot:TRINITY_DN2056_c0_g1_i1.p1 TRINITY_DN2056_c0_g1~~TRINITY_DN2056_c0_g1_i1.p1  ORF type:complete len:468 (-),score=149.67 TRINITY_DN2056_c0_g1_i1:213-1616(-)
MKQLRDLRNQNEELREVSVMNKIESERKDEEKSTKIQRQKLIIEHQKAILEQCKEELNKRKEETKRTSTLNHLRREKLNDSQNQLTALFEALKRKKGELFKATDESNFTNKKLAHNRRYLVSELLSFFPVNKISEKECCVVNLMMDNSFLTWKDKPPEIVATGISYILQILSILCIYLNVNLPYKTDFKGSRSSIWREGSTKKYLLFNSSSIPLEEFQVALDMLNWNVIHLCVSQGINVEEKDHEFLIPNLLKAIQNPSLGSEELHQEEEEKLSSSMISNSRTIPYHSSQPKFSLTATLPVQPTQDVPRIRASTHNTLNLGTTPPKESSVQSSQPIPTRPRSVTYSAISLPSSLDLDPTPLSTTPPKPTNQSGMGNSLYSFASGWLSSSWISGAPSSMDKSMESQSTKNEALDSPVILHHSSDDEEYVVIHDTIPKPEDDEGIANFERAMFIDKVEEPKKKIRDAPT